MANHPHHQEETYTNQHQGIDVRFRGQGHQNLNPKMDQRGLYGGTNNHIQIQGIYHLLLMDMIESSDGDDLLEEISQQGHRNLFGGSHMKNKIPPFNSYISIKEVLQQLYEMENFLGVKGETCCILVSRWRNSLIERSSLHSASFAQNINCNLGKDAKDDRGRAPLDYDQFLYQ